MLTRLPLNLSWTTEAQPEGCQPLFMFTWIILWKDYETNWLWCGELCKIHGSGYFNKTSLEEKATLDQRLHKVETATETETHFKVKSPLSRSIAIESNLLRCSIFWPLFFPYSQRLHFKRWTKIFLHEFWIRKNWEIWIVSQVFGVPLQEWLEPPRNTTVPEGRDAVLACRVKNKVNQGYFQGLIFSKVGRCYWRKNSRLIYLYPGKYDWEGSPAHGDCSLRIKVANC